MDTWKNVFESYKKEDSSLSLDEWLMSNYSPPNKLNNDYTVNSDRWTVGYKGKEYQLQKVPFTVLQILYENRGNIVTRDQIYQRVWGSRDLVVVVQSIEVQILKIRKTIPNIPIITKKRIGYMWEY